MCHRMYHRADAAVLPFVDTIDTKLRALDRATRPERPVSRSLTDTPPVAEAKLSAFVEQPGRMHLHRLWFTRVKARWWTGHVQGVAIHHDGDYTSIYASLSDFPRWWGAAIINDNRPPRDGRPAGMEAMSFPQGRHPGGIAVLDNILAVPIEARSRAGRVYLYDLRVPLYPSQIGHVDDADDGNGLTVPDGSGADNTKASAVGLARLDADRLLLVVLSEGRYLRFVELTTMRDGPESWLVGQQTGFVDGGALGGWPDGFTDNISLIPTDDGLHLVLFTVDRLLGFRQFAVPTRRSRHLLTTFRIEPGTELDPTPRLERAAQGQVTLPEPQGPTDLLRPGFRWGASLGLLDGQLGLITAEYFGNERRRDRKVQYLQFASNLDADQLRWAVGEGDDIVGGLTMVSPLR